MFFSRKSRRKESSRRHSAIDTQAIKATETEPAKTRTRRSLSEDSLDSGIGDEKRSSISLFDIFPKHIAEALRDGKEVEPEQREVVTIFFSDIVGFTDISSTLPARKVAAMLDRLYQKFDVLSHKHDIFKVETIGDAYMAVTNLVKDQPDDHAKRIAEFSIAAIEAANSTLIDEENPDQGCVNIRVGFHSGPVVADVVGTRNPRYCLFGDTVNTASRMESNSIKNRIHCSEAAAEYLRKQHFQYPILPRGVIAVKGKGDMFTYWIKERGEEERKTATMTATANSPAPSGTPPRRAEPPHRYSDRPSRNDHPTNNRSNDVVRQNYSNKPTPSPSPSSSSTPRPMIAVAPGLELPLRSTEETLQAIRVGQILSTECMLCTLKIFCMKEANFILCPACRTVGPASEGQGGGIGLGFTQEQYDQWRMEV